jgi:ATP-dependent protease ClpP protease subunit
MEARAQEVVQWAQLRTDERQRFTDRVAAAAGKPPAVVAEDLAAGIFMGAPEALDYGLIDEVCRPDAEIHKLPGPPIGFRPRR